MDNLGKNSHSKVACRMGYEEYTPLLKVLGGEGWLESGQLCKYFNFDGHAQVYSPRITSGMDYKIS